MPSLAESLAKQTPRNGGLTCTVCDLLVTLNKDDVKALNEALENPRLTATMITRALEDYGTNIAVGTIRRHRRKECATLRNVG